MGIEIALYKSMMKRQTWKYNRTNISLRANGETFRYSSLRLNGLLMVLLWVVVCMAVYGWVYNAGAAEAGAEKTAYFTEDECWENYTASADITFCLINAAKNKNDKSDKQKQKPAPEKRR